MPLPLALTVGLLQSTALQDTLAASIARRDLFDWTIGIMQFVVMLLGAGVLVSLVPLLRSLRGSVARAASAVERLEAEARPLLLSAGTAITNANQVIADSREVVAMIRTDVARISDAAAAVTDRVVDVADVTAQRIDQVNAVLDVLQAELEGVAIGTVSAIRGVRVGTRALAENFGRQHNGDGAGLPDRDDRDGPAIASRSSTGDYYLDEDDDEFLDDADFDEDFDEDSRPA